MTTQTKTWGPATILTLILVTIGAIAGAVVAITNPQTLAFASYLTDLAVFTGAGALTSVGHGLLNQAPATVIPTASVLPAPTIAATGPATITAVP